MDRWAGGSGNMSSRGMRVVIVLACALIFTGATGNGEMEWMRMCVELFGGLALFLYGMEKMAESMKMVAGDRMSDVLAKLTTNRFTGALTGALVTAVLQSSSVTTVLVVGFISAGLMSTIQSVGVIIGSNVGTTITAQIVAFKITKAALAMVTIGFVMSFSKKLQNLKHYGVVLMGLGLVFYGMNVMSIAMHPLRDYQPFLDLMQGMQHPAQGIFVGAAFTALIQSSSATTGIVIVMAGQGFISLPAGIALCFGANVGTCVTALLACIGRSREAFRAATVHVLFNVLGVLIWLAFIPQLANWVIMFSPAHEHLVGLERLAADTPRQIANAHTLFNVANAFIFLALTGVLIKVTMWLVPDRPSESLTLEGRRLDPALLVTPAVALSKVRSELSAIGEIIQDMLERIGPALANGSREELQAIADADDMVDEAYGELVVFMGLISKESLTDKQTRELLNMMGFANSLELIGDLIETDLVGLGQSRLTQNLTISRETTELIRQIHRIVSHCYENSLRAVVQRDLELAQMVVDRKSEINALIQDAADHQAQRLVADEPNRLEAYTLEMEMVEKMKRIYYYSKRMARVCLARTKEDKAAT